MRKLCPLILLVLCVAFNAAAQSANVINSYRAKADFALTADPNAPEWKNVKGVLADRGPRGDVTPGHRTEIRARWTDQNLYLLFICPYEELYLIQNPSTTTETNKLWEWDVAEAFIGSDFQNIKHYTEFQVSPQGEWVDLDIDRTTDPPNHNWEWNSGFEVKARLLKEQKVWYGAMRIPFAKIDPRAPKVGNELRVNFYRLQGPPPNRKGIAWQPTKSNSYHVPEAFGLMRLVK
jgi:hypothetical protein